MWYYPMVNDIGYFYTSFSDDNVNYTSIVPSWIYGDLIQPGPTLLENRQYAYSYDSTYSTATDASYGITTGAAHFWAQWQVPLPQNASSVISSHIYYPYNKFPPASSSLNFIHLVYKKTTRFLSAPNN